MRVNQCELHISLNLSFLYFRFAEIDQILQQEPEAGQKV